MGEGANE
jgi:hypothetical protein